MAFSTQAGFLNRNDQEVMGPTAQEGTDHGQRVYVLRCRQCSEVYGANGSDIALRRCPRCGGGAPGFAVTVADIVVLPNAAPKAARNPDWTRDELILALDLYFELPSPDQHNPKVIALSALLNRFWEGERPNDKQTLRNPSGVSMKLSNFQRFDPAFQSRGRAGLANGAKADEVIWQEFADDRARLAAIADAIRNALLQPTPVAPVALTMEIDGAEGSVLSRLHHFRERDKSLVRKAKDLARAAGRRLACEACDFDFGAAYGPRGEDYIEVHHTRPLSTLRAGDRTKIGELAMLCANCHRMVHAKQHWLSMDELKALVQAHRTAPR